MFCSEAIDKIKLILMATVDSLTIQKLYCILKQPTALTVYTICYKKKADKGKLHVVQHGSSNFTLSIIPERGKFLIVISCGSFNIARDRNTLLGSEILSPLNRRLQCERVRMRLIKNKKIIFESQSSLLSF